jgi:hypothetical protein
MFLEGLFDILRALEVKTYKIAKRKLEENAKYS